MTVLALAEVAEHHDDVRALGPQVGDHLPGYALRIGQDDQLVRLLRHGEEPILFAAARIELARLDVASLDADTFN